MAVGLGLKMQSVQWNSTSTVDYIVLGSRWGPVISTTTNVGVAFRHKRVP